MDECAGDRSSAIVAQVDEVLGTTAILENPYLRALGNGRMSREEFLRSQRQFYFAVDYFPRPMAALLMRLTCPEKRLGILSNVVEEHGDFRPSAFHEATFRKFLESLGDPSRPVRSELESPVHAFNAAIIRSTSRDATESIMSPPASRRLANSASALSFCSDSARRRVSSASCSAS